MTESHADVLARARARVTELWARVSEKRTDAEQLQERAVEQDKLLATFESELAAKSSDAAAAAAEVAAASEELKKQLDAAACGITTLSKQQLQEVRSLTAPPPVIHRALALVYCLLYPEYGSQVAQLDEVPWKQRLASMLKSDDLVTKLKAYHQVHETHPLIAFPAIVALVERSVKVPADELKTVKTARLASSKNVAAAYAARLLRRSKTTPVGYTDGDQSDASAVSPSGKSSIVHRTPLADTVAGLSSRRASGSSALLGDGDQLTIEAVTFASQAVGAIFRWVLAQFRYAKAVETVANRGIHSASEQAEAKKRLAEQAEAACMQQRVNAAAAFEQAEAAHEMAEEAKQVAQAAEAEMTTLETAVPEMTAISPEPAILEIEAKLHESVDQGSVTVSCVEVEIRDRVTFGVGTSSMSSFATRALTGVAKVMQANEGLMICVEGHSLPDEDERLSSERANRVLEELVTQGIPRHRLRAAGFGANFAEGGDGGGATVEFSVIQEISIKGNVQFSPCSSNLTAASEPLLEGVAALLHARPCLRVRVEGHTDNAPNWGCSNLELAEGRAQSVVDALARANVDESRLVAVGFGDKLPKASNSTSDGRSKNRRVEFHILQKETVRSLQQQLDGRVDRAGMQQLVRTATGEGGASLALSIRRAAADVLRRLGADWGVQRLLWVACRREDPTTCPLAIVPEDCIRRVLLMYFFLGCFQP
eukprot:TRINITY_DN90989_c0_g1_i1.p1 TRINITY_DN90989_c0_g1~~TRINITY_DN90989_c0_g1_i1.p1  ORF type:complete len:710 (-),score=154.20 TRINITY_DN90989_c0_g1_i1:61-2190(-)